MYLGYMYLDPLYIILVSPAVIIAAIAQANVSGTFSKYSKVRTARGYTGAEAARAILDANGLYNVRVERVAGNLSDHFDPRQNVIRLSQGVYDNATVAAVGVAAHESGHAVQYATGYAPIKLRNAIVPITQFGSSLSIPVLLLGFFMGLQPLIYAGIILFSAMVVFQLVTLPVEFDASRRAVAYIQESGMSAQQVEGARKVLTAAALTYVAAALTSILQLLYLLARTQRSQND